MPLLGRCGAVRRQDRVDDRGEGLELGTRGWLRAPVARWYREGQHLAHGAAVDAKAPRRLALAQPLDMAGVANPSVELHREHPRLPRLVPHEPRKAMPRYKFAPPRPDYPAASVAHLSSAALRSLSSCRRCRARQPVHGRADKHAGARGRDITRGKLQPLRLALRASPAAHRAEVPPAPRPATSN